MNYMAKLLNVIYAIQLQIKDYFAMPVILFPKKSAKLTFSFKILT